MAISPVHSSNAATQAIQQPKNNTQTQHTQGNQAANGASNARAAQHQAQVTQQQAEVHNVAAAAAKPKPVVNGQGQQTGKIVNATA